jgi:predicted ABC-type exoprotein transport system permease subunit
VEYVRNRTPAVLPGQTPVRRLSDWQPEEIHEHKLTSHKMRSYLTSYASATLSISLLLLVFNGHPYFREDRPHTVIYGIFWSIWVALLCALDAFLVVFQFIKQMKTVGRLRTRGSLSIASLFMLSIVLVLLSLAQFFRSRKNIALPREHHVSFWRIMQLFGYVYGCVSVDVMYLVAGLGYLVLFQLCLVFDWNNMFGSRFGRIQLL